MLRLELKWFDEAGWKEVRPLKLDEKPDDAIQDAMNQQEADVAKYGPKHPKCVFRVVKVVA